MGNGNVMQLFFIHEQNGRRQNKTHHTNTNTEHTQLEVA